MIKIASGWSNIGGSTFSLMELCDLFNERGLDSTFYGPHDWHLDKCSKTDKLQNLKINPDDHLIIHFLELPQKVGCKKVVLSCHETNVYPVKTKNIIGVDSIRFVSERQKEWQGVEGTVIPNLVRGITKSKCTDDSVAGVIGTIHPIKATHESIKRALSDGYKTVLVYGNITDYNYFNDKVKPLLSNQVIYKDVELDRQKIYDSVSCVYQSNPSEFAESFGRIRAECLLAGIEYRGTDGAFTEFDLWEEDQVLSEWLNLLNLNQ